MWSEFPHSAFLWVSSHCFAPFLDKKYILWIFNPPGRLNRLDLAVADHLSIVCSCHSFGEIPWDLLVLCLNLHLYWIGVGACGGGFSTHPPLLSYYWRWYLLNNWASHEHFILGRLQVGVTHIAPTGVWEAWECEGKVKPLIWKSPLAAAFFSPTLIEDAKLLLCVFGIRQIGSADQ